MRISTVAVCTLAALAANELPQAAIASQEPANSEQTPVLDESIGTAAALEPIEAIAPPLNAGRAYPGFTDPRLPLGRSHPGHSTHQHLRRRWPQRPK